MKPLHRTAFALLLLACSDPPPPPAPVVLPPLPPEPVLVAPRAVSSVVAFDLVDSPDGAVLVWGAPHTQRGGLRAVALDPFGSARGIDVDVVHDDAARARAASQPIVEEVSLVRSGATIGVSWVERGASSRVHAALTSRDVERFGGVLDLGETEAVDLTHLPRGRTLLSVIEDGTIIASHRLMDGPCSSTLVGPSCAHVARTRLSAALDPARRDDPMEVPSPCPSLLAGATFTSGTWFYGVCQTSPAMHTTVYAIRPAISFAAATEVMSGCSTEGLLSLGDQALVIGRCGDAMQANVLDGTGSLTQRIDAFTSTVACIGGRPDITLEGGGGRVSIPLRGPRSGLASTLPLRIAPEGARAVWTGSVLLVASALGAEVTTHRFECRDGNFVRTDS